MPILFIVMNSLGYTRYDKFVSFQSYKRRVYNGHGFGTRAVETPPSYNGSSSRVEFKADVQQKNPPPTSSSIRFGTDDGKSLR